MKSYLRFLSRNKLYTAIMAVGLSMAFGFIIIMSCYVWQQYTITRSIPDYQRKYLFSNGHGISMPEEARILKDRIPEIEDVTRLCYSYSNVVVLEGWEYDLPASTYYIADGNFFKMFPVKFLTGDSDCISKEGTVAVCKEWADEHGGLDVLGKLMTFDGVSYMITGIYEGFENSCLLSIRYVLSAREGDMLSGSAVDTVIKLREDTDAETVNTKIQEVLDEYWKSRDDNWHWNAGVTKSRLTNISEVYYAHVGTATFKQGSRDITVTFYVIALLILVSAIFNFINLNSALSGKRMNEMATRLILGERKDRLLTKALMELFAFTSVCFVLGAVFSIALEPFMNSLLASEVEIIVSFDFKHILFYLFLISLVTTVVFVSSSLQIRRINPIAVIKKEFAFQRKMTTAKIFIGLQTVQAVLMIAFVITMQKQLDHMLNMPLGVDPQGVFLSTSNGPIFERTLKSLPYVETIGRSDRQPGDMQIMRYENDYFGRIDCEPEVLKIFGLKITRDFNPDSDYGVWMSESTFGFYNSLGDMQKAFLAGPCRGALEIAGTYEDIAITPAIRSLNDSRKSIINVSNEYGTFHRMYIKTTGDPSEARKRLEKDGEKYCKDNNLEYGIYLSSFEENIERHYSEMTRTIKFVSLFMYLAIFLSILGLIGISRYYVMEQRAGIAIRKVFGGTITSEVLRNLKTYITITSVATVIGVFPAIFMSLRYIENYAYRMEFSPWIFILIALITLIISVASVFGQILSAAKVNPTEVLKKE